MKRYEPIINRTAFMGMLEATEGHYVLFSDHESAVASCRKEWFDKGRNSVLRDNKSGCCCLFNEQDEIVSVCMAHKELLAEKDKRIAELEAELAKMRKFKIAASKDQCQECPFLDDAQKCHEGLTSERDRLEHELEEWKIRFHRIGGQKMLDRLNYLNEKCPQLEAERDRLREAINLILSFIPEGWEMPLGFNQAVFQVKQALKEAGNETTT